MDGAPVSRSSPAAHGLPLVVGVTGHRDIPAAAVDPLRATFAALLDRLQARTPHTGLLLLSALADGADILAAEIALDRNIGVIACLPMSVEEYLDDFDASARDRFLAVLARCTDVRVVGGASNRDGNYEASGMYVAYYSQVIVAFWDGREGRGRGGTADIVRARTTGVYTATADLADTYVPDIGPFYHVVTPRTGQPPPADCYAVRETFPRRFLGDVTGEEHFKVAMERLDTYNRDLTRAPQADGTGDALVELMQRTDAVANLLQRRTLFFVRMLYAIAFLAGAAQLVPGAGEVLKLGILGVALLAYLVARRYDYENRYLDYRAVAEGLRVQRIWWIAGLRNQLVEASYLRMQRSELEWIRVALRTAYLLYCRRETRPDGAPLGAECTAWLRGQWRYYYRASRREERSKRICRLATVVASAAGLLTSVVAVTITALHARHLLPPGLGTNVADLSYLATAPVAMAWLLAVLISRYEQQRGFAPSARRYQRMFLVFDRARRQLLHPEASTAADTLAVIDELGREALAEEADWLLIHRDRPMSFVHI